MESFVEKEGYFLNQFLSPFQGFDETIPHDNDGLHPSLGYFALSVLIFPNRIKPTAYNGVE
ncbi:hypothetical protein [Cognataquiflexum rubidum]|uniref:hypothetical protein n=1 Tax=Cognataquiflexum rubidum TaxID=2922273 RepID=UPI001F143AFD|nr:hypothetical protein [Cognataquiflexum rubidum]MCH6232595.1 hypothetical protein [Cognataquiflexum rubidum]